MKWIRKKYRTCNKRSMDILFLRWHKLTKLKVYYFGHKTVAIIFIVNINFVNIKSIQS